MADPFIGEIKMLGGNYAPRGYAMCNGQTLPLSQNQALFAILGTVYGGDGMTTVGLPDFQGRTPVGWGQGAGLSMYALGEKGGLENATPLITNMPSHSHVLIPSGNVAPLSGTSINQVVNAVATSETPIPGGCLGIVNDGTGTNLMAYHSGKDSSGAPLARVDLAPCPASVSGSLVNPGTVGISGGGIPFPVLNPYQAVTFVIALLGIYPSRD